MNEPNETQPIGSRRASNGDGATLLDHTSEVRAFVAAVRSRLRDLTEEEREELVGGLDADMSDLVAERGLETLPDPAEYAAELRSAAGFSPVATGPSGSARASRDRMMAWLDRGGATWRRWVESGDHFGVPAFAHTLRPAWWVLRALVAAELASEVPGDRRRGAGRGLHDRQRPDRSWGVVARHPTEPVTGPEVGDGRTERVRDRAAARHVQPVHLVAGHQL